MYAWAVKTMIKRNIAALSRGDLAPILAMFGDDAELCFPGRSSWASQYREPQLGREPFATHRGRAEIEGFLRRYVDAGLQMEVEDVIVGGPPWRMRAAIRVRDWSPGADGADRYANRAVLWVTTRWGKIVVQEDFEDTQRAAAFDDVLDDVLASDVPA